MLADFFTKPIQGELFRFFRNIIMGYVSVVDIIGVNNELKERVENWGKYSEGLISRLPDYKEITKKQKDTKDPIIGGTTCESVVGNSNVRTTNGNNAEERTYDKNIKNKERKQRSKRTYDLDKLTGNVRTNADLTIGSGKIQTTINKKHNGRNCH